jgi:MOSC domain-containing protein YiiM
VKDKKIMLAGKVIGIYISPKRGEPTTAVEQIYVVPGKGIRGDRYFRQIENGEMHSKSGQEITLIEIEAISALLDENIRITPDQTRRNIITQGVPLNDLVGCVFSVGNIHLRGIRLCEPCNYLASLTDTRVLTGLKHRGGLRAEIIIEGFININDSITSI